MNQWFGEPWPRADYRAPPCEDDRLRVETPVGSPCLWCPEPIGEHDQGIVYPGVVTAEMTWDPRPTYAHLECMLRNVMGCSASLRGEGHDHEGSYRDDARRVRLWVELGGLDRDPSPN